MDGTLQWTSTKLHVISLLGNQLLCLFCYLEAITHIVDALDERTEFQVNDSLDGIDVELVEGDNLVKAIQKFRCKLLAQTLLYHIAGVFLIRIRHGGNITYTARLEADTFSELF